KSVSQIGLAKTSGSTDDYLGQTTDYLLWYAKDIERLKFRPPLKRKRPGEPGGTNYNRIREITGQGQALTDELLEDPRTRAGELRVYTRGNLTSQSAGRARGGGAASGVGVGRGAASRTLATWCSIRHAALALRRPLLSSGAADGSRSTRRGSRSRWPAPVSWAPAIPTTCSPTRARASSRKPRSRAPRPRRSPPTATSA